MDFEDPMTRWLKTFDSITVCSSLQTISLNDPKSMEAFWKRIQIPIASYLLNEHFQSNDDLSFYDTIFGMLENRETARFLKSYKSATFSRFWKLCIKDPKPFAKLHVKTS